MKIHMITIKNSMILLIIFLAGLLSFGAQAQNVESIAIKNLAFNPQTLTVPAGTTVTWMNYDTGSHTVTSDMGTFDSGSIKSGSQFNYQFNRSGTYKYHCKIDPNMKGTIIVTTESVTQNQPTLSPLASTKASKSAASKYSEYYNNLTGPAPSAHVSAPAEYNVTNNTPNVVYFAQQQAVPYSTYQSNPTYASSNSLWIEGTTNWTQYAAIPQDTTVSLVAVSPTGGSGYLTDNEPTGLKYSQNFFFYPDSQQTFYADKIGRHILTFTIGNQISNPVVVDVIGNPYLDYYYGPYFGYLAATGEAAIESAEGEPEFGRSLDTSANTTEAQAGESTLQAGESALQASG
ncbi:MAG: cupredoxin family copper-binding protein [Methanotrichaceae archaeon]|nr:cupredoxin family copper-binding protein [Methanotrichaceae archaeon]